jgi:hypothetical protein
MRYVDVKPYANHTAGEAFPELGRFDLVGWGSIDMEIVKLRGAERVVCVETLKDAFGYERARVWVA